MILTNLRLTLFIYQNIGLSFDESKSQAAERMDIE
jgi:hypothetical protein